MTLDPHLLRQRLDHAAREVQQHPLAWWKAWHRIVDPTEPDEDRNDPERFSQVESIQALQHHRNIVVWGGSRSGKTAAQMAAGIALVLGSDHPDAEAFWLLNGCDPSRFPKGPAQGWIVALTVEASLQYHRRQVVRLLPHTGPEHPMSEVRGQPWHAWNLDGRGPARIDIMVPGYSDPARIVFKSDTGEDGAKGDECRWILHDEEPEDPAFFDEAEKRLWKEDGWQILCNAPGGGKKRWGYKRFVERSQPRTWVGWLWVKDNPHIAKGRLAEQAGRPDVLARTRGKFADPEGTAFPWSSTRQVVAGLAALIPADWPRHRVIDWGYRDPFCCEWMTWSRRPIALPDGRVIGDGSILVYRERYVAEVTLQGHAEAIHIVEGWVRVEEGKWVRSPATEKVVGGWADSESPSNIASFTEDYGLPVEPAIKGRTEGIGKLATMCEGDDAGPRFFVDESCTFLIDQMSGARFKDTTREELVQGEDHALDVARYGVMGMTKLYGAKKSAQAVTAGMKHLFSRYRR